MVVGKAVLKWRQDDLKIQILYTLCYSYDVLTLVFKIPKENKLFCKVTLCNKWAGHWGDLCEYWVLTVSLWLFILQVTTKYRIRTMHARWLNVKNLGYVLFGIQCLVINEVSVTLHTSSHNVIYNIAEIIFHICTNYFGS